MRKIYSLMLIAAGLLIGTSLQAQTNVCELTLNGSTTAYTNVEDAIIAVVNAAVEKNSTLEEDSTSATIKLLNHATVAYKEGMNVKGVNEKAYNSFVSGKTDRIGLDHGERITLDLNGFTLTANMRFYLSHASLYVVGKENSKLISNVPQCILLMGDNSTMDAPYTYCHAVLGENVVVTDNQYYTFAMYYTSGFELGKEPAYGGIQIDIYGQIYSGLPVGTSGNMQVPNQDDAGNKISGINIPIVNIHKTAKLVGSHELTKITSDDLATKVTWYDKEGVKHNDLTVRQYIQTMYPTINPEDYENTDAAIYAPGYCELNIQGYVEGGVGIYAKAGYLNLDGAIVKATAARYWPPVPNGNGFCGAGSAVVLDSHAGYGAFPGVTIQNSIITSDAGYAIEEAATSGQSKLPDINVESGVFNGEKGSIETTQEERDKLTAETEGGITGGEWHNTDINAYINETQNQTLVYHDADQKEYKIVVPINGWEPSLTDGNAMVKLEGGEHNVTGTMTISDKLFLTNSSKIVVKKDAVLNVGTLIISDGTTTDLSSVTVEPGGKLFVTGNQGVFSRDAECIIIKANADGNGLFLIAPEIIVNTHPLATVEYYAANIGKETLAGETYYNWDRFGSPVNSVLTVTKNPSHGTSIRYWNYAGASSDWKDISAYQELTPFVAYAISHVDDKDSPTYTFTGDIVGNASSRIDFISVGLNFFANSYVAPAEIKSMLTKLSENPNVEHTIYVWKENQSYDAIPLETALDANNTKHVVALKPMQAFAYRLLNTTSTAIDIDYKNSVWNYAKGISAGAPSRMIANNDAFITISVASQDGKSDDVDLREASRYDDEFNNGAEATKILSDRNINLYVATDYANQASVATDNILGTALNLQTRNDVNYTMSFSNVRGEQYAIQDLETGVITAMEEGATYDFVAPANETIEGRFVVVAPRATPTNLQNAHVGANVMKTMKDGRLMIIKNGRCFDAMGVNVK